MTKGYISYLRGADPFTFAKRVDKGVVPKGLLFTKIIQCKMKPFQRKIYDSAIEDIKDTLDRKSEAVANFAFPVLSQTKNNIVGDYGNKGINVVKSQLKSHYDLLNKKYKCSNKGMEATWRDHLKNQSKYLIVSPEKLMDSLSEILYKDLLEYLKIRYWS